MVSEFGKRVRYRFGRISGNREKSPAKVGSLSAGNYELGHYQIVVIGELAQVGTKR